ncbi:MAG TPA: GNAT family N-acetyltransferase [Gammaproteobacteria bacterium]|nr:GNAT family N-acetyltransferase [Gammaproteobacteria bacterium]
MEVRVADFAKDFAAIELVRETVFWLEQRIPRELEFDDRDPACIHLLALDHDAPIGTARLDLEQRGKIGRVAVLAAHRRRGVATALMQRLHGIARDRGLRDVWCNAQIPAIPLYERLGYAITSEPFDEAGIPHVRMQRTL